MDILTHALSGLAFGTVSAGYSKAKFLPRVGLSLIGSIGAILPDIDAISLWSGFDLTIGKLFNLTHSGKEIYFSKFWYSHHGFFHSLLGGVIFTLIIVSGVYLYQGVFKKSRLLDFFNTIRNGRFFLIAFVGGFVLHLLQDMPTPSSVWGGVNLFWPSANYIGGYGSVWWWNNYDLFLIALDVVFINIILLSLNRINKRITQKIILGVFISGSIIFISQIKSRKFNFNYLGHTSNFQNYELTSKEIQKKILGDYLYCKMVDFDNQIKLNF